MISLKLHSEMKNNKTWQDCTTRIAGRGDLACKYLQYSRALAIVDGPGNHDRLGIWTYCGGVIIIIIIIIIIGGAVLSP
jgi:hypothetical protein